LILVGLLFLAEAVRAIPSAAPAYPLAQAQPLISYQGMLTDQSGMPINGTTTMAFSLYDALTAGNLLWGPENQTVQVSEGLFHVLLGSVEAIDPADLLGDLWLEITVNGEALTPREQLASVVNSINAGRSPGTFVVGSPGIGEGGEIKLVEGSTGNDWHIDNRYGSLRAYHDGITYLTLSSTGNLSLQDDLDMNGHDINLGGGARIWTNSSDNVRIYTPDGSAFEFTDTKFLPHRKVDMQGNSIINCGALTEANLQTAEELAAERIDRFEEGDVLCWGDNQLEKCTLAGDPLVQAIADTDGRPIVIGAEPVKVIGLVKRGDFLVASDVPGYAMAARSPAFGTVIAQALEDFDGERGIIKAMIRKL
jgi:hypothetical protein